MRSGDLSGPMAESGFKGHPQCRFCRKRFYGDNELFVHMQSDHEQCFLCRRARPDRYVYYKDYNELEGAACCSANVEAVSQNHPALPFESAHHCLDTAQVQCHAHLPELCHLVCRHCCCAIIIQA